MRIENRNKIGYRILFLNTGRYGREWNNRNREEYGI